MELTRGFEPRQSAYKADVLPIKLCQLNDLVEVEIIEISSSPLHFGFTNCLILTPPENNKWFFITSVITNVIRVTINLADLCRYALLRGVIGTMLDRYRLNSISETPPTLAGELTGF